MNRYAQFYALTKPRVVQLIVFCAVIGMVLAIPGLPSLDQLRVAGLASLGICWWPVPQRPSIAWSRKASTPR